MNASTTFATAQLSIPAERSLLVVVSEKREREREACALLARVVVVVRRRNAALVRQVVWECPSAQGTFPTACSNQQE